MAQADYKSVDEYISAQPEAVQHVLHCVRRTIRMALPGALEVISYKMLSYEVNGVNVLYFAVWKKHYSLYPARERVVAAFQAELAAYEVSKGTIRFPLGEPVPVNLIERIAKFRAKEVVEARSRRGGRCSQ